MAMVINDECINCGACEPECPNEAIAEGSSKYVITVEKCTECVGAFDQPKCLEVCPVENCVIHDPAHVETRAQLDAKYQKLHG
jgi:ferredoxin